MRSTLLGVILMCLLITTTEAQVGTFLKDRVEKGKKTLKDKAANKADADRDKLDSTDYNYAITVIDNSGMMNIRDRAETMTKAKYAASNMFLKDNKEATPAQKCRDLLTTAQFFYEKRQFKLAEFYFLAAKTAYENEKLTDNINYSKTFSDLGLLYATMGKFNSASQFTQQALEMREESLGQGSFGYAASVNNRAVLYQDLAFYNEAEKDFEAAKATVKNLLGETQELSIVLNNEAILYAEMGRNEEAIGNLQQATAILDKAQKKSVNNQVGIQSNLAHLYQRTNKLPEAEAIYLKLEKDLGSGNPYYAGVLNNLALLYVQMNKPEKVEDYLKRAAAVYKTKFGEESPSYAKVIGDQGWYYRTKERYTEAEPLLQRSMEIREKTLGTDHPDYVKSREELAILYWKSKQWEKAYNHYKIVMDKTIDFINKYFPPMSEAEKTKYWDAAFPRFQRYYNFAIDASTSLPNIVPDVFDYQTATKALLLNATSKVKNAIVRSGNQELIKDYLAWLDQKESLSRYYSLSKEEITDQKINIDSIEQAANRMEKSLSERSKEFSSGYATQLVSYKTIKSALTDQEAVVEIIRVRNYVQDFTGDSRYAMLVMTKTSDVPKLVVLDNGNQLENRYSKFYKNSIQQKSADEHSFVQFWSKIEPALSGKKTVYISPDGVYNQINLNTLKNPSGVYILNQYDLITVGNSKDLLAIKARKPVTKKDAFLLGFPDYGGTQVAALPGTKVELDGINKILKASGYQTKQLMQKDATEAALKALKAPTLLHIATHGYFKQDTEVAENGALGISMENAQENPLLRSGLLLAGASVTISGTNSVDLSSNDNGIVTAYEVMNMNLDGTDLIILSACETGLGEVKAGEGVYGLQRAFMVAGANALIMSLWKVDDAATQQLMTNFYTSWAKTGNKQKAFKQAQLQLMTKYKDPYYWGAFVMMGL
ncbi:MAG TPA: CHAT domain-containing tetratricopeptide repeat protein [Cyclobacteriaceae bacterium]|nr:CHAT domain-containing tetratricopeptide repeat protein [Cyclobacteriaceae bacterium]